jgi:flagellar protein FlgJ
MLRPELAPRIAIGGIQPSPVSVHRDQGSGFAALFGEIRNEVADFIENGAGEPASAALSAEGQFYRSQLQSPVIEAADAGGDRDQKDFLASIAPWAKEASQRLGVSADILSAHAALESGWGKHPLRGPDGSDTHNLFGVKAGRNWQGSAVNAATTEYENGLAVNKTQSFRSFSDQASAFRDFTRLLLDNPRYQSALNTGGDARAYAQGLLRGGYATDPAYADKLARVAARIQSRD